jgi:hypothetical protein
MAERHGESALWRPHEDPWLRELCEQFARDGEDRLSGALAALLTALGIEDEAAPLLRKADAWSAGKLAAVKARLQKPVEDYAPGDWLALIDLVIQTRFSPTDLEAQAAWLTARAQLAARLDVASGRLANLPPVKAVAGLVTRVAHRLPPPLAVWHRAAWGWASARVGALLRGLTEGLRARVSGTVIRHIEEHGLAARGKLEQALRDDFADLNRDWRRVAITEAGEVANQTYLGEHPDGTRVNRLEAYEGACPFCKKLNGQVFVWSTRPLGDAQGWTHVWPGKTNEGRSASPRKMTPEGLVERDASELWWPAAGLQHPNCRGRWVAVPDDKTPPGVDPDFDAWLKAEIRAIDAADGL